MFAHLSTHVPEHPYYPVDRFAAHLNNPSRETHCRRSGFQTRALIACFFPTHRDIKKRTASSIRIIVLPYFSPLRLRGGDGGGVSCWQTAITVRFYRLVLPHSVLSPVFLPYAPPLLPQQAPHLREKAHVSARFPASSPSLLVTQHSVLLFSARYSGSPSHTACACAIRLSSEARKQCA